MQPIGTAEDGTLVYEDGIEPYVIRTTDRNNFKKCRRLWHFSSGLRRNLEPVKLNHNLAFGISIHKGLEAYYDPEGWTFPHEVKVGKMLAAFKTENERQRVEEMETLGNMTDERRQEYADREILGVTMLIRYAEHYKDKDNFTPVYVEQKFQIPVPGPNGGYLVINNRPVVYQVRIDLVLEDNDGRWWVCDHKTAGSLSSIEFLDLDTQMTSYAWAAQMYYGRPIVGILYNELEKVVPHKPKTLKNGSLSTDKRQLTTYDLYLEAIYENGLDPDAYSDMLEYLRNNERDYFRRTPLKRTNAELQLQGQYVIAEAADMLSDPFLYPNPSKMNCGGCDFFHPCVVANEGGDVDFVLNNRMMYRERTSEEADANLF